MSRGGRRLLWVLGIGVCFAGFLVVTTLPKQPQFAQSVKMLAGLRPVRNGVEALNYYSSIGTSARAMPAKRNIEVYELAGGFQEIHDKLKLELKPRAYVASSSSTPDSRITIYGIHDKMTNRNVVITLREESKTKTSLTIAEPVEPGVWDRVVAWFHGFGKPKPAAPEFVQIVGGGSGVIYAAPAGKVHRAASVKKGAVAGVK